MPDPASCIRFIFLSFKEGIDHSVQNRTGSDLDGLVRCWFNASGLEVSWCARNIRPGSGKTQPARYQFPTFRPSCILPQMAQFILCKAILDPIWFWLNDLVWKQAGVQKSSCLVWRNATSMLATSFPLSDSDAFFHRRPGSYCAKPAWIQFGFGYMHLVWKQAGVQESSGLILAERNQPTTSFPSSDSVAFFHRRPGSHCAKPAWIQFGSG